MLIRSLPADGVASRSWRMDPMALSLNILRKGVTLASRCWPGPNETGLGCGRNFSGTRQYYCWNQLSHLEQKTFAANRKEQVLSLSSSLLIPPRISSITKWSIESEFESQETIANISTIQFFSYLAQHPYTSTHIWISIKQQKCCSFT